MNNQTAFDKVYAALVKQRAPAWDDKAQICSYRTRKNTKILKCAVGHLIPRKEYRPSMEGKAVTGLEEANRLPPSLATVDMRLLVAMQNAHDYWGEGGTYSYWKKEMAGIAKDFGLKVPHVSRT